MRATLAVAIRCALYGGGALVGASGDSPAQTAILVLLMAGVGLLLERRLSARFDGQIALAATLVLFTSSATLSGHAIQDRARLSVLVLSSVVFFMLGDSKAPRAVSLVGVAALAAGPAVVRWAAAGAGPVRPENLLSVLLGGRGVLYGAPLLWAGVLGWIPLRRQQPALARTAGAAVIAGLGGLLLCGAADGSDAPVESWLPFLLPGLAWTFERLRSLARRRPERILAAAAGLLVLWNLLFMEQYRRLMIPADKTVSFSEVTANSGKLLAQGIGTPFAWPANWIFAEQFQAPLELWDGVAGRHLFASPEATAATIELGDDPSAFAPETALLANGFGMRKTCEKGWCRDLDGEGRIFLPIEDPGQGDFVVTLRARGEGAVQLSLDDAATTVSTLSPSLADVTLRVPARLAAPGLRVLSLKVTGGTRAAVDRITLQRESGSGSATGRPE